MDAQAVEQVLENMMANGIDGDGVEHKRNCLVPFLSMEANAQVQVQDYDVNQNFHGLCGVYDLEMVNGWSVPLVVQQLDYHVYSYG